MNRLNTILISIVTVTALSCTQDGYVTLGGYAQGGKYAVKYNRKNVRTSPEEVQRKIDCLLTEIDTSLSGYNKGSYLSRRNASGNPGKNRLYDEVRELSDHYKALTDGAFDPFAAPLFDIWGFGFTADSLPDEETISKALEECRKEEKVNFNAIAQGYSCDVIAGYLYSIGVKDMLVDIGEIYCDGLNPKGEGWTIGIDTPADGNNTPGASLSGIWKSDGGPHGVVTSGNYRKFYIRNGRKYPHTIDPRTGRPVTHNLLSATVIAPSGAEADAMATYFMVVGTEEAIDFIRKRPDIEACLITSDSTWVSEGFGKGSGKLND